MDSTERRNSISLQYLQCIGKYGQRPQTAPASSEESHVNVASAKTNHYNTRKVNENQSNTLGHLDKHITTQLRPEISSTNSEETNNIMCWNMHSFKNIFRLSNVEENKVVSHNISCLIETWLIHDLQENPALLRNSTGFQQRHSK